MEERHARIAVVIGGAGALFLYFRRKRIILEERDRSTKKAFEICRRGISLRHTDVLTPRPSLRMPHQPIEGFDAEMGFRPRPTDICIATFPKTGNTLVSHLLHQMRRPGDKNFEDIYDVVPFLEFLWPLGVDDIDDRRFAFNGMTPRVFKHHRFLSACCNEWKNGKFVCTFRNPKDAIISLFQMCRTSGYTSAASPEDFVEESGLLNETWGWGANIFKYYVDQWRCRDCSNVVLLCFEDLCEEINSDTSANTTSPSQMTMLRDFAGIVEAGSSTTSHDEAEYWRTIRYACSRENMLRVSQKFDESVTYARMRKLGRWTSPFRSAARVTDGSHHRRPSMLSQELSRKLDEMWKATMGKEFGIEDYDVFRGLLKDYCAGYFRAS